MKKDIFSELISKALDARKLSYSPYSGFKVGACVLMDDGAIFSGANIENASYGLSICAERVAASKALTEKPGKKICAIAIAGSEGYAFPCGACRQFLLEFNPSMDVIVAKSAEDFQCFKLCDLIPSSFGSDNLIKK